MTGWSARLRGRVGDFGLDVALEGDEGVLALVGPNGSGKTTVLRALTGAVALEEAEIVVAGRVLAGEDVAVPIEDRHVGYVPQGFGLFPHLTALDNAAFALSVGPGRLPRAQARRRALEVLEAFDCGDLAARRVRRLSGGEQQRVALARALCADPALLLLDEPLSALDATTRRTVRQVLARDLAALGRPTVLVTHDVRDIAAFEATVAVLEAGRVVQTGRLDDLAKAPATDFVAELVEVAVGRTRRRGQREDRARG